MLVLMDGFDYRLTAAALQKGWSVFNPTAFATGGPFGRGAFASSDGNTARNLQFTVPAAKEHATMMTGYHYADPTGGSPISSGEMCSFWGDGFTVQHVTFVINTDGTLSARRGSAAGTVLGTSTQSLLSGGTIPWQFLEFKATIHDSAGAVRIRVGEVDWLNLTGIDTRNGGTAPEVDGLLYRFGWSGDPRIDNVYIVNGDGTTPNDLLGEIEVQFLAPNGNGNSSQLVGSDGNSTDNYLLVDEVPFSSTDYVGSATDGQKDTYALTNPSLQGNVVAVQPLMEAAKSDAGAKTARRLLRTGGTDYAGADVALSTTYAVFTEDPLMINPNTGVAWTISDVNALEWGFEVRP